MIFLGGMVSSEQNPERSVATKLNQGTKAGNTNIKTKIIIDYLMFLMIKIILLNTFNLKF